MRGLRLKERSIADPRNERYEGKFFFIEHMKNNFAEIAEGKTNRIGNPKCRVLRHSSVRQIGSFVAEKTVRGPEVIMNEVAALAEFRQECFGVKGGMQVG